MFLLVALLIIVPVVELVVLVQVAQWIGVWEALFLLVAVSLLGAWMVKLQGIGVIRRITSRTPTGRRDVARLVDVVDRGLGPDDGPRAPFERVE